MSDFESKKKENHQNFTRKTSSRISSIFKNYKLVKTPFLAFFRPVFGSQSLNMAWKARFGQLSNLLGQVDICAKFRQNRTIFEICSKDQIWPKRLKSQNLEFWAKIFEIFFFGLISSVWVSRSLMPNFRLKKTKNEPENPF